MATLSDILVWRIPWTEEPGMLQFMGLQRVGPERLTPPLNFSTDDSNSLKLNSPKALNSHEEEKKSHEEKKKLYKYFLSNYLQQHFLMVILYLLHILLK